jgi:hypothetical protein
MSIKSQNEACTDAIVVRYPGLVGNVLQTMNAEYPAFRIKKKKQTQFFPCTGRCCDIRRPHPSLGLHPV